jgi:hypothetical protein
MCSFGQRLNFIKDIKKVALIFGGLNNLITLSLRYLTASPPHLKIYAPSRVNIRLSMLSAMGSLIVFYPHDGDFLQSDNSSF